jgi:ubiquinone/menaquinone biosynthesis C-methylase UbiE
MTDARQCRALLGIVLAAALLGAWHVYGHRARERVVSHEGLEDPEVAAAFNRIAGWPQMALLRWFVTRRALSMVTEGQAVDLGCGPGHFVVDLAQAAPNLQVTGVDLSDEMLAQAEDRARRHGLADRIAFKKGDAAQIPFPDGSLDLVVSTLSLHHWSNPVGVLDEIARVLRPGGSFLVFDLRRDMPPPFYLLLWFATRCVVPTTLRQVNEPLGSRDASFTAQEAAELAGRSRLTRWDVTQGPLWLTVGGRKRAGNASHIARESDVEGR